jgi:hypothetical protein
MLSGISYSQTLIAHYPFDNSVKDISSNNNQGRIIGGVSSTKDRFGNPCGAMFFDGKDGYIEVPSSTSLESISNYLSVSCWFYIPKTAQNSIMRDLTLICKGDQASETTTNPQYRVQVLQMANQSTISINTAFTKNDNNYRNHLIEFDKWNFYCLTYDGSEVKTYLNGNLVWTFPFNTTFELNKSPLHIGKDMPGGIEYFRGALDDLKIFNGVLSQQQISSYYSDKSGADFNEEFSLQCPSNIIVSTPKNSCSAQVNFKLPTLTAYCGTPTVKQISGLPSGSQFPLGSSIVAFLAEGQFHLKSACDFSITVNDNTPPVISCNSDTTIIAEATATTGINYTYTLPIASDNCSMSEVKLIEGQSSNTIFKFGTTKLKFQATDKSGNVSVCSYNVTVIKDAIQAAIDTPVNKPEPPQKIAQPITPPVKVENDSIYYEHELTFKDCTITVVMYDDGEEDNDTISLYYNGKIIVDRQMIRLKKNEPIIKALVLNPDELNLLVSKAWNVGKVPPNTLKIEFYEGNLTRDVKSLKKKKPDAVKVVHSRPGLAGAIKLKCKL